MKREAHGLGDGDVCPVYPAHGRMLVLSGNQTQYCPHRDHDGYTKAHPDPLKRELGPTRSRWPYQFFKDAVAAYNKQTAGEALAALPDIDMEAFSA